MAVSSSYIASLVGQQQSMYSGQLAYAQQLSYPMQQQQAGLGGGMQMPPPMPPPLPPPPPPMTMMGSMDFVGGGGIYGEQLAARAAGMGRMGMGVASAAGGLGLGMMGLDPFQVALRAGGGMSGMMTGGGLMAGLGAGAMAALPIYAAGRAVDHYAGSFTGGMRDQAALNSTLRNNFSFFGGQGAMGRGFGQNQMGQIGAMMSGISRSDVFTNPGELNQLVAGGAEAGMMTGVRDVTEFSTKFKRMLETLKTVQRELGGTLTEALSFVKQSKQVGIFNSADQGRFAQEMRTAEATTGLDRGQLFQLSSQGAQMSRAVGGTGRQGAMGALRTAETLGSAVQIGAVSEEALSEATGGLTGSDAVQAMVGNMMHRTARFSRRSMGRFSHFALSNEDGTGLDPEMLERFRAGDLTVGQVSGRAHQNVGRMGRGRAMRQEGVLRGAMLEEGGLSGQVGMMRLMLGDRVMDQGDDVANLVMRRRFGMSGAEADVMTSLMRNQGSIAEEENLGRSQSRRQQELTTDLRNNRSMDGFMRHLGHSIEEATGTAEVREMGRRFVTRISTFMDRAVNDMLGVAENQLSSADMRSLSRLGSGRMTDEDRANLFGPGGDGNIGGGEVMTGAALMRRTLLQTSPSAGQILQRRGVANVENLSASEVQQELSAARMAALGHVTRSEDLSGLKSLTGDVGGSLSQMARARLMAAGSGDASDIYRHMGATGNAVDAFARSQGFESGGSQITAGSLLSRGGGRITGGMVAGDIRRMMSGNFSGLQTLDAMRTGSERAASYFARGGDMAEDLERRGAVDTREGGVLGALVGRSAAQGLRLASGSRAGADDIMLTGMRSVREEDMQAVLESREGRRHLQALVGAEQGSDAYNEALEQFNRFGQGLEGGQQLAASSLGAQLGQRGAAKFGESGTGMADRARAHLQEALSNNERQRQLRAEMERMGGEFGELGEGYGLVSKLLIAGEGGRAHEEVQGMVSELARMDPESKEYRDRMSVLGRNESGRGVIAGTSQYRQLDRALSGRGRRGPAQAAETALGMLTGGTLGQMEVTSGGRRLNATQIQAMLRGGNDEQADSIIGQLEAQMGDVSGAGDMLREYRGMLQSGGGLNEAERDRLIRMTGGSEDLAKRQREGMENRLRQQNPLDAARNDLLTQILNAVKESKPTDGVSGGEGG